ncbi:MAG: hypothetical protein ACR2PO_16760 [Methyloligellaceae bacterium]
MLDFLYQTGWGAFSILLFFQLPFMVGFLYIVYRRASAGEGAGESSEHGISRAKTAWLTAVVVLFFAINIGSIKYIPAISTARAVAAGQDIVDVQVTAQSWSYEFSQQEFTVGEAVRFTAKAADTVHGFAIYHPKGRILFTMMLIPGVSPSSLIYTFKDPGTYKVRCLEYCGIAHHEMNDEIIIKPRAS